MVYSKMRPYFFSRRELSRFLSIAVPMVISTGTDAVMMFIDRLFLSQYAKGSGEAYLNAALIGALTAFSIIAFFAIVAGYSNAMVAQYHGAKQAHLCARVVSQTIFFACAAYPLVLAASAVIPKGFLLFKHSPLQTNLESTYTRILLWGSLFSVVRSGVGGFFIGIHKTNVIMFANVTGMLVNIPLNYALIFGVGPVPALGIAGAAIATAASSAVALCILLWKYYGKKTHEIFATRRPLRFDGTMFKKLLRFGMPSGVETVCGILVFDFFISAMSAYGETVGAAATIAINWDSMFFIPMVGAGFATTSIVGNHMGARDIFNAKRAVFLSCVVMVAYAVIMSLLMLIFAAPLVEIFLGKMQRADEVRPLAKIMVRLASLYLIGDAINLSIAGALRGAGDTKAVMTIFLSINAVFGVMVYVFTIPRVLPPLGSWFIFIGFAMFLGIGSLLRFLQSKWQHIRMVEDAPA